MRNGAKPRKAAKPKAARLDNGISLGVLLAFPTDSYFCARREKKPPFGKPTKMKIFRIPPKKTRVSANMARREIRPCYAAVALRVSRSRSVAPGSLAILLNDDRGGWVA